MLIEQALQARITKFLYSIEEFSYKIYVELMLVI